MAREDSAEPVLPVWWPRFLEKTVRLTPDPDQEVGCLYWCGAQSRGKDRPCSGFYGSFFVVRGLIIRAHIAAAWAHGLISEPRSPPGMHVEHDCRRSLCVEPTHLRLLPGRDNCAKSFMGARPLAEHHVDEIRMRGSGPSVSEGEGGGAVG